MTTRKGFLVLISPLLLMWQSNVKVSPCEIFWVSVSTDSTVWNWMFFLQSIRSLCLSLHLSLSLSLHCLLHCNLDNCDIGVRLTPDYRGLPRAKGRLLENSSHLTFSLWGEILKTDLTSSQMDFLSPAKSRGWREGAKKLATYSKNVLPINQSTCFSFPPAAFQSSFSHYLSLRSLINCQLSSLWLLSISVSFILDQWLLILGKLVYIIPFFQKVNLVPLPHIWNSVYSQKLIWDKFYFRL